MPAWDCPKCRRRFARVNQGHECAPAMSLDEYFSTGPAFERPIFEAVMRHLDTIGPVHIEPVSVGIFLKRARSFAQLRPMTKWVALSFSLAHPVQHRAITRKVMQYHGRYWHVANLRGADDLDDPLRAGLTEAYLDAPE
jgi:hypothetical protein